MASKVVIDTSQLNKIVNGLKGFEKQMPGAAINAVNRTLDHVNTKVGRFVTGEYNISVKDVKATITKHRAGRGRINAWLKSRSRRLTFSHFRISTSKKAVKVKIKKGSGFKKVRTDPAAFVQSLGGRKQIMKRIGKGRFPVEVLRSITVPQMLEAANVAEKIQAEANKKLAERIEHEMDYRLKKVGFK
jgi:hypothetical protein